MKDFVFAVAITLLTAACALQEQVSPAEPLVQPQWLDLTYHNRSQQSPKYWRLTRPRHTADAHYRVYVNGETVTPWCPTDSTREYYTAALEDGVDAVAGDVVTASVNGERVWDAVLQRTTKPPLETTYITELVEGGDASDPDDVKYGIVVDIDIPVKDFVLEMSVNNTVYGEPYDPVTKTSGDLRREMQCQSPLTATRPPSTLLKFGDVVYTRITYEHNGKTHVLTDAVALAEPDWV